METKVSVFMSVMLIFIPLLLFADNTSLYLVVSFFILLVLSVENILLFFKPLKEAELTEETSLKISDPENGLPLNIHKLELGFKTAKVIFIATFVISAILILHKNMFLIVFSILVLFMSIAEIKNFNGRHYRSVSAAAGVINIFYLAIVALTKYLI